jgi:hypothetical protein
LKAAECKVLFIYDHNIYQIRSTKFQVKLNDNKIFTFEPEPVRFVGVPMTSPLAALHIIIIV